MKRSFYDFPALYDAIHLPDTPVEALAAWALIERHHGGARHLLEPGCGTGRFLSYFARRGLTVTGYDTNARALAFARRRLRREAAVIVKSSMTSFRRPNSFDAAYCLIGTFRHLLTERDAIRHLRLTAEALKPGGVYVVGLDLVDYTDCPADEEGWEVRVKNRRLRHLYMTIPPRKRRRLERIINFVTVSTSRGDRILQDDYDLRSYDLVQWKALLSQTPLRLAGTYTAGGRPLRLSRRTRYALFALIKA